MPELRYRISAQCTQRARFLDDHQRLRRPGVYSDTFYARVRDGLHVLRAMHAALSLASSPAESAPAANGGVLSTLAAIR